MPARIVSTSSPPLPSRNISRFFFFLSFLPVFDSVFALPLPCTTLPAFCAARFFLSRPLPIGGGGAAMA